MLIAAGVNRQGYRKVSGIMIGDGESEASWEDGYGRLVLTEVKFK
ncbi:MAG: transposase [Thermoanaerobacteraceae bacterium]|nr:transposase [Thermoanaerobacteraceae bacterium]